MKSLSIYIVFLLIPFIVFSQTEENKRKSVLKKGIINKTFTLGKWDEKGNDELNLTYLGIIKSETTSYKVMTSLWIWGISGRATSRILFYDINNNYIGEYYLTMSYELPKKIKSNKLYFNLNDDCKGETEVSFEKGIPKHLVLNCNKSNYLASSFGKN
jgi:hypothetical protein